MMNGKTGDLAAADQYTANQKPGDGRTSFHGIGAYRTSAYGTSETELSRRALMGNGMLMMGAGAMLGGLPFAARGASPVPPGSAMFPNVGRLVNTYVSKGMVASMVASMGGAGADPVLISQGPDTLGRARMADADSIFRIYSMTKPITGMAVMMLISEGRLGLDQPLHEILPQFANMKVQKQYDGGIGPGDLEPAIRPITIRHLLTHTSGLGYSIIQNGPIKDAFNAAQAVPGVVTRLDLPQFKRGQPAPSLAVFADRLAQLPLVYQPGTRWSYSTGIDLLGRVIEVVSAMAFDDFLQQRIFGPCGMTSTWFQVPQAEVGRLTSNYAVVNGELYPLDPAPASIYLDKPPFPFGGAGLASTPRDYDRFLKMLAGYGKLEGKQVMSEPAVRLGTSDLFPDTMAPDDPMMRDYGFGAAGRVGKGADSGIYGWAGAAGTVGFVDLKRGLRMGLFTQYMPAQAYPIVEDFTAAVRSDVAFAEGAA